MRQENEKRMAPRMALDADFCEVAAPGGAGHLVIVRDISLGGIRVEFSSCEETSDLTPGSEVVVSDMPEAWEGLAGKTFSGYMAWRDGHLAGICFDTPLPAGIEDFWYYRIMQLDLKA